MANSNDSKKPEFTPWANALYAGIGLVFGGFLAPMLFKSGPVVVIGGISIAVGLLMVSKSLVRVRGQKIEQNAISRLRLPKGWKIEPNVMLPSGGDLDLLVTSPRGKKFAIEIKSFQCLKRAGLFSNKLVKCSGGFLQRQLKSDPVAQSVRNAESVGGIPVLWLPEGEGKNFKLWNGLRVVHGRQWRLRWAIGASWMIFF